MKMSLTVTGIVAALAGTAAAQQGVRSKVETSASGTIRLDETVLRAPSRQQGFGGTRSVLWTDIEPVSVPGSCGISLFSGSAWVGEQLNNERLQRFPLAGPATSQDFLGTHVDNNYAATATATHADLAVFLNRTVVSGPFMFYAFRSTNLTTPLWTLSIPEVYTYSGVHNVKVSRDGSVVAVAVYDNTAQSSRVYFLNGNTGAEINQWNGPVYVGGVDLTDDGSRALLTAGPSARLVNTTTLAETFSVSGSGQGGWYNISGDGNVIVVGGFSFQVYKSNGNGYQPIINFNAPNSWFSWGSAVSRDGSTVGAISHNYGNGYLSTDVRIWDVATTQLLGTVSTTGTGALQDSAAGGVLSDNGQVFAVASWGTQDNVHPEVRVFNRSLALIDSLDTPGSPFTIDMSGDGQYVLVGAKSIHANGQGNGGRVVMLQLPIAPACYANCDGTGGLTPNDFQCFLNAYVAGLSYANCDGVAPLTGNDFQCFLDKYVAGCS